MQSIYKIKKKITYFLLVQEIVVQILFIFAFLSFMLQLFWVWALFPLKMSHMTKQSSTVTNMSVGVQPSSANHLLRFGILDTIIGRKSQQVIIVVVVDIHRQNITYNNLKSTKASIVVVKLRFESHFYKRLLLTTNMLFKCVKTLKDFNLLIYRFIWDMMVETNHEIQNRKSPC